jgi:hypothetical protein
MIKFSESDGVSNIKSPVGSEQIWYFKFPKEKSNRVEWVLRVRFSC